MTQQIIRHVNYAMSIGPVTLGDKGVISLWNIPTFQQNNHVLSHIDGTQSLSDSLILFSMHVFTLISCSEMHTNTARWSVSTNYQMMWQNMATEFWIHDGLISSNTVLQWCICLCLWPPSGWATAWLSQNGTLRWRHNGRDIVSNHQPHHCLLNRLFGRRSK